jgi:hypothetical protein
LVHPDYVRRHTPQASVYRDLLQRPRVQLLSHRHYEIPICRIRRGATMNRDSNPSLNKSERRKKFANLLRDSRQESDSVAGANDVIVKAWEAERATNTKGSPDHDFNPPRTGSLRLAVCVLLGKTAIYKLLISTSSLGRTSRACRTKG